LKYDMIYPFYLDGLIERNMIVRHEI
jgi:hypothetical protein